MNKQSKVMAYLIAKKSCEHKLVYMGMHSKEMDDDANANEDLPYYWTDEIREAYSYNSYALLSNQVDAIRNTTNFNLDDAFVVEILAKYSFMQLPK